MSINENDPALNNFGVPIAAMTGFQKHLFDKKTVLDSLEKTLSKGNKMLFLQNRLTGALDNYTLNSHVSMKTSLRKYRTIFDSKRVIVVNNEGFLQTIPFKNVTSAALHRSIMSLNKASVYSEKFSQHSILSSANSNQEFTKYFLRICCEFFE
jgi:hypothetical protein